MYSYIQKNLNEKEKSMISREICQRVLHKAVSTGADYAEIFAENTADHVISMIDSKVESIKDTVIAGASVRV